MKKSLTAFGTADILLPDSSITDMSKWAVVACDQFTSQPEYWEDVEAITADSLSAYNLILPEAYLGTPQADKAIAAIHSNMQNYIDKSIFKEYKDSMIYIERTDSTGKVRCGIVGAIDLEQYDFRKGSTSPVRATEATVTDRIPPRLKVRQNAPLELPHIMILIDDPNKTVIEKITEKKSELEKVYDFELMKNGGSIKGYLLNGSAAEETDLALSALADCKSFGARYGLDTPLLLYAMGDGNHSLATAKEYYEQLKRENPDKDMSEHPARYALAEIVNLHSDALEFEAIHRIIDNVDTDKLLAEMTAELGLTTDITDNMQEFTWICGNIAQTYGITKPVSNLTVGSVQSFIDKYLSQNNGSVDYIHGEDVVRKLAQKNNSAGILLPDMGKDELFPTVIKDGALPRKTFSMGHAEDKRYYIEARKISL